MDAIRKILQALARLFGVEEPRPAVAETIDQIRSRFVAAYNNQDYAMLCGVFHEHAAFRGSVHPDRWTFTRDSIITERYMSSETCTAISQGARATPKPGTRSVGSMELSLTSERITPVGRNYAMDTGNFRMVVNPGVDAPPTAGPYVILWRKEGNDWHMMHMDMKPE